MEADVKSLDGIGRGPLLVLKGLLDGREVDDPGLLDGDLVVPCLGKGGEGRGGCSSGSDEGFGRSRRRKAKETGRSTLSTPETSMMSTPLARAAASSRGSLPGQYRMFWPS